MAKEIEGDILEVSRGFICHQCNCTTRGSGRGLAREIFMAFPEANVYRERHSLGRYSTPGGISVFDYGRICIVNLYGQRSYRSDAPEEPREKWFRRCLERLAMIVDGPVYFPHGIGCGLGGGDWDSYREMIEEFASRVPVEVFIIKKSL